MDPDQYEKMWQLMRQFDLHFVDEVASIYKCCICKNIIINAAVTPCDCRFCFRCVNRYLEDGHKRCPGQSELCKDELLDLSHVLMNRGMNSKISKFQTNCPNDACQSIIELNQLADHLIICDRKLQMCPFAIIGCRQDKMTRDQICHHISIDNMDHVQLMIDCICQSNNELDELKRQLIKCKSENELEKEKMRLENKELTDKLQEKIHKMKEAMRQDRQNAQNAIQLLVVEINKNKIEIDSLNEEMNALKHVNQTKKEEMKSIKDIINQLIDMVLKQTERIEEINGQFQRTQSRSDEIHENFPKKIKQIWRQFDCMKTQSMITMTKLLKIVKPSIVGKESGGVIWTIKNWTNVLAKRPIKKDQFFWINEGDPFESHHQGYQICLTGQIDQYYLYVYFRIYNGSYDNILHWPFDREVQISIIDQVTGGDFLKKTRDCSKYPNDPGLKKPIKGIPNKPYYLYYWTLNEISENPNLTLYNQLIVKFSSKAANN